MLQAILLYTASSYVSLPFALKRQQGVIGKQNDYSYIVRHGFKYVRFVPKIKLKLPCGIEKWYRKK